MFGTILIQRVVSAALCAATLAGLPGCGALQTPEDQTWPVQSQAPERTPPDDITFGTQTQRGFVNGNVYHSELGDIHFSSRIPESYDGSEPYGLFITLPGWEGLYFQGVGANMVEDFGTEAVKYNDRMIVLSTQPDDWGETSADHTIALTEYFLEHYNIGQLLVLDVRPRSYFTEHGFQDQHAGGQAFAHDGEIMDWIFSKGSGRAIPEEPEYIPEGYTHDGRAANEYAYNALRFFWNS